MRRPPFPINHEGWPPHHTAIMIAAEPALSIRSRVGVVLLFSLISLSACRTDTPRTLDLSGYFSGMDATFILIDGRDGTAQVHNPDRAQVGFLPASTFKIPNTIVALDSGVADGPDFYLEWDSTAVPRQSWWPEAWSRHNTLRTALPASVVWYYQEIARRVGAERMEDYLERFDYGNADISGGNDRFWLSGGLRITAEEQVDFLQRFYHGGIAASPDAIALTKELLVLEETPAYRLSGKTGLTGQADGGPDIGWFVGYVERGGDVFFFALNLDVYNDDHIAARTAIARSILENAGLIGDG